MIKSLLVALAAPVVLSNAPVPEAMPYAAIKLVRCGWASGTAFQVTPELMVTAAHVTANGPCSIDGKPVETVRENKSLDYAIINAPGKVFLRISCDRPRRGRFYRGIGYAGGLYRMDARLKGRAGYFLSPFQLPLWGMSMFDGNAIPGMSGGPILNEDGKVVALINAGNYKRNQTLGRALRDTELCRKR